MSERAYSKLPLFIVLDVSASMGEENRFEAAFNFIPKLLDQLEDNTAVADKVKVSVITFGEEAQTVFPLNDRDALRKWYDEDMKNNPIEPVDGATRYSSAFKELKSRIYEAVEQIRADSTPDGNNYSCFRPTVFFVTDGNPFNDSQPEIDKAFKELTDEKFFCRPLIVCIGIGDVSEETLDKYAAGRYSKEEGGAKKYIVGNKDLVLVQKDGVTPAAHLRKIIVTLIQSIVQSTTQADSDDFGLEDDDENDGFTDLEIDIDLSSSTDDAGFDDELSFWEED